METTHSNKINEDAKILSQIGQKIISCLSVDEIISTVYKEVNTVMTATSMNLGIYNKEKNRLDFPGTMEKGNKLEFHYANLDETFKLPIVCFNKKLEIIINDLQKEAKAYTGHDPVSLSDDGEIVEALIYLPLFSREKILGVISVQSFDKNTYTEYHLDLLRNIGNYVGIAIENAQLYNKMEENVKERTSEVIQQKKELEKTFEGVKLLNDIAQRITICLSVEEIIEEAYDQINKLMDASAFAIGIHDFKKRQLFFPCVMEEGKKLEPFYIDITDNKPATWCFNDEEEVIIQDNDAVDESDNNRKLDKVIEGQRQQSVVYLPLKIKNKTIGVITVQSPKKRAYKPYQLEMLRNIAVFSAIALENASSFESIATLSEIGKEVSASLDLNFVLKYLYKKVNEIMDAPIFLASSYSNDTKIQSYELCIENGKRILEGHSTKLISERDSIAAWVVHNKKEVIINDLFNEYQTYIDNPIAPEGDIPESLIYIPLIVEDEVIGIFSIQSLAKNAYTKHHVELLRSLASYVSSAFKNALTFKELDHTRREMEKLSIVASETDNAVIIMDKDGSFEWVNKAYEEMSGFNLQGLIESVGPRITDIQDDKLQAKIATVYKTKKSTSFESSFITKYNTKIWVQTNISPVLNRDGEIVKLVALDSNITERKQSELKIREKNKDITDSINYASRIQRAMLPKQNFIDHILPNSFILYKPRDIVSGDFYWLTKTPNEEILVATVDCTGHGVPGAFLTIVGNNLLNQIINVNGVTDPGEVLTHMNILMLKQFEGTTQGGMKDGMDMSLCKIVQKDDGVEIVFAGAFNSLYHMSGDELHEIKADRFSIGTSLDRNPTYNSHTFKCMKGDRIYLCSDGFVDQIGGERAKKYKKTNFIQLLKSNSKLPISEQKEFYNDTIENWRGSFPQLDDILLMGIEF